MPAELKARGRVPESGRESGGPIMVSDLAVDSELAYQDEPLRAKMPPNSHQIGSRRIMN